jgi:hypothetical protein
MTDASPDAAPRMRAPAESLLSMYLDREALAQQLGCSGRTLARYEDAPNGLPSLTVGGRKFYRIAAVQDWLAKRERKPNPRRGRA